MNQPKTEKELQKRHDKEQFNPALAGLLYDNNVIRELYYVVHNTKKDIADALFSGFQKTSALVKKHAVKGLFGVLTATSLYVYSPQIGYDKNDGRWAKADDQTKKDFGIDSLYTTNHTETNHMIRLVSGLADSEIMERFMQKYGHQHAFDSLQKYTPKDTLLYQCLAKVLMSIHNPHMGFEGDYKRDILGDAFGYDKSNVGAKVDEVSAYMQVGNVKKIGMFTDTTHLKQRLDSLAQLSNKPPLDSLQYTKHIHGLFKEGSKKVLNNIFAEAGHIRGLHKDGVIKYYVDYVSDYIKSGFTQLDLYKKPGSQEYRTHTEDLGYLMGDEGILIAQFIELYESEMPQTSIFHMQQLIGFLDGFFDNYKDAAKAQLYRERLQALMRTKKATP